MYKDGWGENKPTLYSPLLEGLRTGCCPYAAASSSSASSAAVEGRFLFLELP